MDDASRLLARVVERDTTAFEQLYDSYHRLVYGIALRMLNDVSSAEDLTQSVFLKLWSAPHAFHGGNFTAWLSRVTRNRALDVLRSRTAHPETEIPCNLPLEGHIDNTLLAHIHQENVRRVFTELPDEQRSLLELSYFGGITQEELARRTATPLATVKTRIHKGLRTFRTALERNALP